MNRRVIFSTIAILLAACGPAGAPPTPERAPLAALRRSIDSLVANPRLANAQVGVLIVNPATGDTLYSHNAGKLFMPASNQKVLTAAVALAQLGPDYRFTTVIGTRGTRRDSVLTGDLIVVGTGDPTISDRFHGSAATAMEAIADSIRARGIKRVTG